MGMHICNECKIKDKCHKAFDPLTNYGKCINYSADIRIENETKFQREVGKFLNG